MAYRIKRGSFGLGALPVPVSDAQASKSCDSFTCASPGVINSGGFSVAVDQGGGQLAYQGVPGFSLALLQQIGLAMPPSQVPCSGPSVGPGPAVAGSSSVYTPGMCDNPNYQLRLTQAQTQALLAAMSSGTSGASSSGAVASSVGLSLSSIPWWGWLGAAAVGVMAMRGGGR